MQEPPKPVNTPTSAAERARRGGAQAGRGGNGRQARARPASHRPPLLDLRRGRRGRLPASAGDPAAESAAGRRPRAGPLDADRDQARGAGRPPQPRAAARAATAAPAEEGEDWFALIPSQGAGPEERAERHESIARSREALQALKPAELRALTLLAEGYSYAEIGEITGFSRTKVNRCLAEGRERYRSIVARSESGDRCAELRPLLSAFCDGEASREQTAAAPRAPAGLRPLPGGAARLPRRPRRRGRPAAAAAAAPPRCSNALTTPLADLQARVARARARIRGADAADAVGRRWRLGLGVAGAAKIAGGLRRHGRRSRRLRRRPGSSRRRSNSPTPRIGRTTADRPSGCASVPTERRRPPNRQRPHRNPNRRSRTSPEPDPQRRAGAQRRRRIRRRAAERRRRLRPTPRRHRSPPPASAPEPNRGTSGSRRRGVRPVSARRREPCSPSCCAALASCRPLATPRLRRRRRLELDGRGGTRLARRAPTG